MGARCRRQPCSKPASSGLEEDGPGLGALPLVPCCWASQPPRPAMPSVPQMKRAVNGGKPLIISRLPATSEPAAGSCIRVRMWGRMKVRLPSGKLRHLPVCLAQHAVCNARWPCPACLHAHACPSSRRPGLVPTVPPLPSPASNLCRETLPSCKPWPSKCCCRACGWAFQRTWQPKRLEQRQRALLPPAASRRRQ